MFSVGLTGGIGSGKTAVSDRLALLGATIIDSDCIAHTITAPGGAAIAAIEQAFGKDFLTADGALDRAKMRSLVFNNPEAKARLEAITHPLIRAACAQAATDASGTYLVYVVPLLVESNSWRGRIDRILVVDCSETVQIARVMRRSGLSQTQVLAIMANQASRQQRLAAADDVIVNDGDDLDRLNVQIDNLHRRYLGLAHHAGT